MVIHFFIPLQILQEITEQIIYLDSIVEEPQGSEQSKCKKMLYISRNMFYEKAIFIYIHN